MGTARAAWSRPWLHLPRRTLRVQLTLFYAAFFFVLCLALLTIAGVPVVRGSSSVSIRPVGPAAAGAVAQHGADVHQLFVGSAIALVVSVALSLGLGWLIAGRLLRPLQTITAAAQEISASNLHRRLVLAGPDDEFRILGATLNNLFGRLEASFQSQRRFVANASHELRTPLTAERSLLQVALADPGADVATLRSACEEVLRLGVQQERLIESLLTLASSEGGVERWDSVDLGRVAQTIVLARREEAADRAIRVTGTCEAARIVGDPNLVGSLVANLVDNALRHNVPGGWMDVSTATNDGAAMISVRNSGPLIASEEIARLVQPFQQLGQERIRHSHADGHGLGLAIVQAIANAHGATFTVSARPDGGLDVQVAWRAEAPR